MAQPRTVSAPAADDLAGLEARRASVHAVVAPESRASLETPRRQARADPRAARGRRLAAPTDGRAAGARRRARALALPELDGEVGAPEPSHPPPLPPLTLPFDLYWDVFDPLAMPPDEPVAYSLIDDVADIRADLRRGLDLFDRGYPAAACWSWRFHFRIHWGEHLVGAQRALFLAQQGR